MRTSGAGAPWTRAVLVCAIQASVRRICSGVVPQQPPTTIGLLAASAASFSPKYAALSWKNVRPPTCDGYPALGMAISGLSVSGRRRINSAMCTGPHTQFSPAMCTSGQESACSISAR